MTDEKKTVALLTMRQYWRASTQHKGWLTLSFLVPLGGIALNVGLPFFATSTLASIATQDGSFGRNILLSLAAAIVGFVFNRAGFTSLMKLTSQTMGEMNNRVFRRTIDRSTGYHANSVSGKLVSDVLDYTNSYSTLFVSFFTAMSSFFLTLVIGLGVIFLQSIELGLFVLVMVSATGVWTYIDTLRRSRLRIIRHAATKRVIKQVSDSFVNAHTVKIFANEDEESKKNQKLNKELARLRAKDWTMAGHSGSNRLAILIFGVVALLVLLNYLANNNPDSLGPGLFAFTYTFTFILRLFEINALTRNAEESFLRAMPTTLMMEEPLEIVDAKDAEQLSVTKGQIDFQNVTFHYEDDEKQQKVFKDLNLTIKPGEKVGLIGPSGGGKTTLTRILLRLDDIQSGSVRIDDHDVKAVTQKTLRQNIGYVPQEPLLFHRSIGENISYGKPDATKDEIAAAARKAQALQFIRELPHEFDTVVGERGVKLSGGQRQRIAIARAILKNAPILVLDEATSALDSESELLVKKSLDALMKNKTSIVIAHRLSTIQKMDRIIVLDQGKVVEEGTHNQLIKKKNGLYARLWKHQSGGFLEE